MAFVWGSLSHSASLLRTHFSRSQRFAQEFFFEPISFIKSQVACLASVRDCLPDERRPEMSRMHVTYGARGRRNGYAFDLPDILRFEIRVMKH